MRIAEGIDMLPLQVGVGERTMTINPTAVGHEGSWVLIDTGMPGTAAGLLELARQAGYAMGGPQAIVLTHQDIDHVGGLPELLAAGALPVYAHADDRDAIDGKAPFIKFSSERRDMLLASLPEAVRIAFEKRFLAPADPNVTRELKDGDTLPYGGGLTVIHTPGHTPGHVALYHQVSRTLIAGDSMVVDAEGQLQGPNSANTPDMEQALRSLRRYEAFEIDAVICYHGGLYRGEANRRISELVARS